MMLLPSTRNCCSFGMSTPALPAHSFFESGHSLRPLFGRHAFQMADYDVSHLGDDFSACLFLASQDPLQVFLEYRHA
jgi:hypothetical protein